MLTARTDQMVLGYLGRALSLELSAVQLYTTQARLVSSWGLTEPATKFREEAVEEMQHADRIIARMLAIGVAPNASQLRPVRLGKCLDDILTVDILFEQDLIGLYQSAVAHCISVSDYDHRTFFSELLAEEQAHANELNKWQMQLRSGSEGSIAEAGRRR